MTKIFQKRNLKYNRSAIKQNLKPQTGEEMIFNIEYTEDGINKIEQYENFEDAEKRLEEIKCTFDPNAILIAQ